MELKPCPFCKSTNIKMSGLQVGLRENHWIICLDCECNGPTKSQTREMAELAWNRRDEVT